MKKLPIKDIEQALKNLGRSSDTIAASLQRLKCKGDSYIYSCPLANYIKKYFNTEDVWISPAWTTINRSFIIKNPRFCKTFIARFDSGKYPFLIK